MTPTIAEIQKAVCERFDVPLIEMKSQRRHRSVARPRQVAMYLARQMTPFSLPEIGRRFDRDHTTVIHACEQIPKLAARDRELAGEIDDVVEALKQLPLLPAE